MDKDSRQAGRQTNCRVILEGEKKLLLASKETSKQKKTQKRL